MASGAFTQEVKKVKRAVTLPWPLIPTTPTFKQCRVMVDLARRLAAVDPELKKACAFDER